MTTPEIRLADRLARSGHFHTPARRLPPVAARRRPTTPRVGRHAPGRLAAAARVRAPQSPTAEDGIRSARGAVRTASVAARRPRRSALNSPARVTGRRALREATRNLARVAARRVLSNPSGSTRRAPSPLRALGRAVRLEGDALLVAGSLWAVLLGFMARALITGGAS